MCIALVHQSLWLLYYYFLESFLSREMFFTFTITSVISTAWEALRAFLTGNRQNRQQTTRKPRQKRAGSVLRHAWVCAQVHSAEIHAIQRGKSCFRRSSHRKRWTGTQFIAWPWSVAGTAGKPVSARSGIGFVDGRQSRYGKSPDDSPHDSPRRFDSWLDSRVTTVIKTPKRRFDSRVKSS